MKNSLYTPEGSELTESITGHFFASAQPFQSSVRNIYTPCSDNPQKRLPHADIYITCDELPSDGLECQRGS